MARKNENPKEGTNAKRKKGDGSSSLMFDLLGLTSIVGITAKKAAELHIVFRIKTIKELYEACKEGRFSKEKFFTTEVERKIKSDIELNVLWLSGQCKKVKNEMGSNYQQPLVDKEFLLKLANELNKENKPKEDK